MAVDPGTGGHKGCWIDSSRGMYEGKGRLEGGKEAGCLLARGAWIRSQLSGRD